MRATYDLDVVYARGSGNIQKVVAALKPLDPGKAERIVIEFDG